MREVLIVPGLAFMVAATVGSCEYVFAAASMTNALDDVDAAFTKQTGVKVVTSYDASSALVEGNIKKRNAPKVRLSPPCRAKSIKRKAAHDAGPLRVPKATKVEFG